MKDDNLKILIINHEFPPLGGGGGVATYDLAVEWAKEARVDILTSSFKGLPVYEVVDNIHVYRVRAFYRRSRDAASFISMLSFLVFAFIKGIRLFRKNRYQVINTHFAVPAGPLGYMLGKMFRVPNVLSLHGGDIYDPSKRLSPHKSAFFKRVVRFILNRADAIVAQSSNTKGNTIKYYNPDKEISIIPLAFHPPVFSDASREQMNIENNDFILITIGRIVKRKAMDIIIRAMNKVVDKRVKLLILGDGPEKENLLMLVEKAGLVDRVKFLGYVSDVEKYRCLQISDLFVLTSLHEGFGIVFMEAMFCGLPIVCTNHGGQVDFLKEEENAILIDVDDVDACADAIHRFYMERELYSRCSGNNMEKIKEFYAENVAGQYICLFKELL